jgi:hypothetical protein
MLDLADERSHKFNKLVRDEVFLVLQFAGRQIQLYLRFPGCSVELFQMVHHDLRLLEVDQGVSGGVRDQPPDVSALLLSSVSPEGVVDGRSLGVERAWPDRLGDEPLPVVREGLEEDVDVVDAFEQDYSLHRVQQARTPNRRVRRRQLRIRRRRVKEDGGDDVRAARVTYDVDPRRVVRQTRARSPRWKEAMPRREEGERG